MKTHIENAPCNRPLMLCGSHFCPFSPISLVEQWPQAKRAVTY
jgi:hypothetical protein